MMFSLNGWMDVFVVSLPILFAEKEFYNCSQVLNILQLDSSAQAPASGSIKRFRDRLMSSPFMRVLNRFEPQLKNIEPQ
jgi:hypothetical protein